MANEHYRHEVTNTRRGLRAQIFGVKSGTRYFKSLSVREATNLRDSVDEAIADMQAQEGQAAQAVAVADDDVETTFVKAAVAFLKSLKS